MNIELLTVFTILSFIQIFFLLIILSELKNLKSFIINDTFKKVSKDFKESFQSKQETSFFDWINEQVKKMRGEV